MTESCSANARDIGWDFSCLTELLDRAVNLAPDHTALIFPQSGATLTYRQFHERVLDMVATFQNVDVSYGDRIGVMLENRIEYPILWFALAHLGAIMVPINANFKVSDAGHLIRQSGCRVVVCDSTTGNVIREVCREFRPPFPVIDVDAIGGKPHPVRPISRPVVPETIVNIQFTSGSTGLPKGCMISHKYWLTMAYKNAVEVPGLCHGDVLLTAQPFSYMDPMWSLASAVAATATLVVLDRFHPSTFWASVVNYGVTFFYCLGVMPRLMLKSPVTPDERNHLVRVVCCSGISPEQHEELQRRFSVPWLETYGMTEIGNGAAMRLEDLPRYVGTGSIGRATTRRELRVIDEAGLPVPRGHEGELVVRGVGLMDGYFGDPEATAYAFRGGWFHTGDLVSMDEDGFLFFHRRRKDMIRRSGENISASEVEEIIQQHPAVLLAACVAVPDDLRGEEIKAFVVLRTGTDPVILSTSLPEYCEARLAYFKVPRYWEARRELPLTPSSKVAKSELTMLATAPPITGWDKVEGVWR